VLIVQQIPQVDMVSPTAGQPCCSLQHPPHPLEKKFEGIRDVNVSVSLMEDFMRCTFVPFAAFRPAMQDSLPRPCS
jgi:hypothetical protein